MEIPFSKYKQIKYPDCYFHENPLKFILQNKLSQYLLACDECLDNNNSVKEIKGIQEFLDELVSRQKIIEQNHIHSNYYLQVCKMQLTEIQENLLQSCDQVEKQMKNNIQSLKNHIIQETNNLADLLLQPLIKFESEEIKYFHNLSNYMQREKFEKYIQNALLCSDRIQQNFQNQSLRKNFDNIKIELHQNCNQILKSLLDESMFQLKQTKQNLSEVFTTNSMKDLLNYGENPIEIDNNSSQLQKFAEYSQKNQYFCVIDGNHKTTIYDNLTNQPFISLDIQKCIIAKFVNDKLLVCVGDKQTQIFNIGLNTIQKIIDDSFSSLDVSQDQSLILFGKAGSILVYDAKNLLPIQEIQAPNRPIQIQFNDNKFFSLHDDLFLRIYNLNTKLCEKTLAKAVSKIHTQQMFSYSQNQNKIILAGPDKNISIIYADSFQQLTQIQNSHDISCVIFTNQGGAFFSGDIVGVVKLWKSKDQTLIRKFQCSTIIQNIKQSYDNDSLIILTQKIQIWKQI